MLDEQIEVTTKDSVLTNHLTTQMAEARLEDSKSNALFGFDIETTTETRRIHREKNANYTGNHNTHKHLPKLLC
jgi:hypothetical protein